MDSVSSRQPFVIGMNVLKLGLQKTDGHIVVIVRQIVQQIVIDISVRVQQSVQQIFVLTMLNIESTVVNQQLLDGCVGVVQLVEA
jgi:hypothetical protein